MGADHLADIAGVREPAQLLAHLLATARDRLELGEVGQREEERFDLLVDARGEQSERLRARLLGREARVALVGGEHGVHRAGRLAEQAQPFDELVPLPGAKRRERELPAVAFAGDVILRDRERRFQRRAEIRGPAFERSDRREATVGEEAEQLELRVHACLDAPVDLEHEVVVEDERRVRLLATHRPHARERAGRLAGRTELDHRLAASDVGLPAHALDELARELVVGECVVRDPTFDFRDAVLPLAPEAERHLVELVRAGMEPDLDDREREQRLLRPHDRSRDDLEVRDLARLRAEPALREHELAQCVLRDRHCEVMRRGHTSSGGRSWNQKKSRGPSVSRYGSSPTGGNAVRPNISSGTIPRNRARSSSTACAERATL